MEAVYEQLDDLRYHGHFTFTEAYNLPLGLRKWHYEKLKKRKEEEAKQYNK